MKYALVTVARGIIEDVIFFSDPGMAVKALEKYDRFMDNHKYKHNYDYVLTINMMNREKYFTNGSIVVSPGTSPYAGIANLKYGVYKNADEVISGLNPDEIQVICGHGFTPFGQAQCPGFFDYADSTSSSLFTFSQSFFFLKWNFSFFFLTSFS